MAVAAHVKRAALPLPGGSDGATVGVHPMVVAEMRAPPPFFDRAGHAGRAMLRALATPRAHWLTVPIPAFLIEHPTAGPILVDTAFPASVATDPRLTLGRVQAKLTPIAMTAEQAVPARLRARGIEPEDVRYVVMTHLHYDHAAGVSQFPHATFVVDRTEWDAASHGGAKDGYRHRLFDHAFDWRYVDFASRDVDSFASFGRAVDLLGDGSIRLVATPGHTRGHLSVVCRIAGGELLLCGDAAYARRTIDERLVPLFLAGDEHHYRRSLDEIARYVEQTPGAVVLCGHDPWRREDLERSY